MASTTFSVAVPQGSWTEVYDGADAATIGIQVSPRVVGPDPYCALYIGTSSPASDEDDYFVLGARYEQSWSGDVASGDKVYAKALGPNCKVRGYVVV